MPMSNIADLKPDVDAHLWQGEKKKNHKLGKISVVLESRRELKLLAGDVAGAVAKFRHWLRVRHGKFMPYIFITVRTCGGSPKD